MSPFSLAPVIALTVLLGGITSPASADTAGIPASLYPSGTRITDFPSVSNSTMDCQWGFFCEGSLPVFHLQPQDELQRVGGWAQYAVWQHDNKRMHFVAYGSQCTPARDWVGRPWSRSAFDDFQAAILAQGYQRLRGTLGLLPKGLDGGASASLQRCGPDDLIAMAAWAGSREVEALAVFGHRSPGSRRFALTILARQLRAATHDIPGRATTPRDVNRFSAGSSRLSTDGVMAPVR